MFDMQKLHIAVKEFAYGSKTLEDIYNEQNHSVSFDDWYQELLNTLTSEDASVGVLFDFDDIPHI